MEVLNSQIAAKGYEKHVKKLVINGNFDSNRVLRGLNFKGSHTSTYNPPLAKSYEVKLLVLMDKRHELDPT